MRPTGSTAQARARVEGAISGLTWRRETLGAWIALLGRVGGVGDPDFVDWLAIERVEGREYDMGIRRHWLDPTKPLAKAVLAPAHGVLVTSATLRGAEGWPSADARTGASHLAGETAHFEAQSPFDYGRNAEVLIVTDLPRGDIAALAGAYARLIETAGGGTLGPVHRDPAAARGPCADRRPAGARRACRCWRSMSTRSIPGRWSISSATIRARRCSAPMRCATGSTCRANRCGWW